MTHKRFLSEVYREFSSPCNKNIPLKEFSYENEMIPYKALKARIVEERGEFKMCLGDKIVSNPIVSYEGFSPFMQKVISIMNILRDSDLAKNSEYLKICEEYKCTPKSEKILLIITDGNYSKLEEMIQFFEKEIFDQNISQVDIRLKISTFVEKDIFSDEANKESLQDNIYLILFKTLSCIFLILI